MGGQVMPSHKVSQMAMFHAAKNDSQLHVRTELALSVCLIFFGLAEGKPTITSGAPVLRCGHASTILFSFGSMQLPSCRSANQNLVPQSSQRFFGKVGSLDLALPLTMARISWKWMKMIPSNNSNLMACWGVHLRIYSSCPWSQLIIHSQKWVNI